MKKKFFWGIGIILLVGFIGYGIIKIDPADIKPTIKIGITLPLSGNIAFAGVPAQKAIELSLADIQKKQTLKYKYELVFADDQLDSKLALLNYQRFKSLDKVQAVISMWGNTLPISLQTDTDKIIHFGCGWGYELGRGFYNFNNSTLPDEQIHSFVQQLKKRKITKIGIVYNMTKGEQELVSLLKPQLETEKIQISFINSYILGHKDFKSDIAKMKESQAELVLVTLTSPSMENFIKQSKTAEYNPAFSTFNVFAYTPELFEGQWFIDDAVGNSDFVKHFETTTGEKAGPCVANLYDALGLLVYGFENASVEVGKVPDNELVVKTMLNSQNPSPSLEHSSIDAEGNIHTVPTIKIIRDKKIVPIE